MANEVVIRIKGDSSHAEAAMASTAQAARNMGQSMVADVGRSMQQLGKAMTIGITAPLAAITTGALKSAIDFESAFAGVRKTVDGTEAQLKELETGIRQMALTVPVGTTELSRIAEAAGQLGIKRESILEFTKTIAAMGVATNLAGDEAATALARLINITGDSQDKISNLGAAIVALGNDGASTEKEIVDMALRLGGAGRAAGLATTDILGIANALSSMGIEAEAGGTAFSRVMIDMFEATKTGGEKLQLFAAVAGMSAEQFRKAFKDDAASAITAFVVGLGKAKDAGTNIFPVLEKLELNEIRVRDALLRTSGAQQVLTNSINVSRDAWVANTALTTEAEKRYATTAKQLELLKNKVADVAIDLGEELVPALHRAVDAADPMIKALKEMAAGFAAMPKEDQENLLKTLAALAAAGPVISVVGGIAGAAAGLAKALAAVGAAATAHPLIAAAALAVAGLAAATYALAQVNKPPIAGEELADLAVTKGLGEMNREIERTMGLIDNLGPAAEQIGRDMEMVAQGTYDATARFFSGVVSEAERSAMQVGMFWEGTFDYLAEKAASLARAANNAIGMDMEQLMQGGSAADRAWAKDAAKKLKEDMGSATGGRGFDVPVPGPVFGVVGPEHIPLMPDGFPTVGTGGGKAVETAVAPSWTEASAAAVTQGVNAALAHEQWRNEIKKMVASGDLEKAAAQYRLLGKDASEAIADILADLRALDDEQREAAEKLARTIEAQWEQVREAVKSGMQVGAEGFTAADNNAKRFLDMKQVYADQEMAIQQSVVENYLEGMRIEAREGLRIQKEAANARIAELQHDAQREAAIIAGYDTALQGRLDAMGRDQAQQARKSAMLQRFGTESEVEALQSLGRPVQRDSEGGADLRTIEVLLNVDGVSLQRAGNRQAMVRGLAYGAMGGGY